MGQSGSEDYPDGELTEKHTEQLVSARKMFNILITIKLLDKTIKNPLR